MGNGSDQLISYWGLACRRVRGWIGKLTNRNISCLVDPMNPRLAMKSEQLTGVNGEPRVVNKCSLAVVYWKYGSNSILVRPWNLQRSRDIYEILGSMSWLNAKFWDKISEFKMSAYPRESFPNWFLNQVLTTNKIRDLLAGPYRFFFQSDKL